MLLVRFMSVSAWWILMAGVVMHGIGDHVIGTTIWCAGLYLMYMRNLVRSSEQDGQEEGSTGPHPVIATQRAGT